MTPPGISGGSQFSFGLGGGGDIALTSSGNFALRGQLEYFGIHSNSGITPNLRSSGGVVYRFGRKHLAGS